VSNPVNVIVSDRLGVSAASLVPVLLPAALASVVALLGCLLVMYRRQLPARAPLVPPSDSWASWTGVPRRLLAAFGWRSGLRRRVGAEPASGADDDGGVVAATRRRVDEQASRSAARRHRLVPARLRGLDGYPRGWPLVRGITAWLAQIVLGQVRDSPAAVMVVTAFAAAVGANLVNNLPAAFVFADAVQGAGLSAASAHAAALGTIIGADLGPNLTPVGSVATLLCSCSCASVAWRCQRGATFGSGSS